MARLTMKTLSEQLHALIEKNNKTISDDNKLKFFLQHEQIMALRHDRDYLRESVSSLSMLAAQQAEVIAALTEKVEELAKSHNSTADEVEMLRQRIDRTDARELQTFTLSGSNANRLDTHGAWIAELFRREEQRHQE